MPQAERCQPLPLLNDGANMGHMALDDVTIAGLYGECARRNAAWVEWRESVNTVTKD